MTDGWPSATPRIGQGRRGGEGGFVVFLGPPSSEQEPSERIEFSVHPRCGPSSGRLVGGRLDLPFLLAAFGEKREAVPL